MSRTAASIIKRTPTSPLVRSPSPPFMLCLAHLLIFFVLLMPSCPGCKRSFDNIGSMSTHKCYCRRIAHATTSLLRKRKRDFDDMQQRRTAQGLHPPETNYEDHQPVFDEGDVLSAPVRPITFLATRI